MNKKELVKVISEAVGTTQKAAGEFLDATVEAITDALVAGEDVKVSGFGTFSKVEVPERTGIIQMGDRKGETYVTPAHFKAKFKPASALKEAVK